MAWPGATTIGRDNLLRAESIAAQVPQYRSQRADQFVDLLPADNERRSECDDVARGPDQKALLETSQERLEPSRPRFAGPGVELNPGHEPHIADVDHVGHFAQ